MSYCYNYLMIILSPFFFVSNETVQVLQVLLELESQYGTLPQYTPVIDDIMTFIAKVNYIDLSVNYGPATSGSIPLQYIMVSISVVHG